MVVAVMQNIESQLHVSKESSRPRIKKQKNSSAFTNWTQIELLELEGLAFTKLKGTDGRVERWRNKKEWREEQMGGLDPPIQGSTRSRDAPPNLQSSTQKKGPWLNTLQRKCLTNNNLILLEGFYHLLAERKWSLQRQNEKWRLKTTKCLL